MNVSGWNTLNLFLLKALLPVLALFPTSSENFVTLFGYPILFFPLSCIFFSQSATIITILLLTKVFSGWNCEYTPKAILASQQLCRDWHPLGVVILLSRRFIKLITALKLVVRGDFVTYSDERQEHCIYSIFPFYFCKIPKQKRIKLVWCDLFLLSSSWHHGIFSFLSKSA